MIRPSRPISTRSTSAPAFRTARSARVRSVSLNVAGPCPMTSPSLNFHVRSDALAQRSESSCLLHSFCIGLADLQKLAVKFLIARIVGCHEQRYAQVNIFFGSLSVNV